MFNALRHTEKLVEVGFTKQQAETALELGIEVMNENLARKEDLKEAKNDLRQEIKDLELRMHQEFSALQDRLTIRMGAGFAATIAILGALKFI